MYQTILALFLCIVRAVAALCFVSFFNDKKIVLNRCFCLFAFILTFVNIPYYFWNKLPLLIYDSHDYVVISLLLNFLIVLIFSLFIYKNLDVGKRIVPAFIYLSALFIAITSSNYFMASLYHISVYESFYLTGMRRAIYELTDVLILLLVLLLMTVLCKRYNGKFGSKLFYILLPFPILSMLVLFFRCFVNPSFFSYFINEFDFYFIPSLIAGAFSSVGFYALICQMWRKSELEREKELYENMLQAEHKRYEDMQIASEQIRKIRHDIKNMLYAVKVQMEEEHTDKARRGLEDLLEQVNSAGSLIHSENRMIDYILNAKLASAENKNIRISGDASGMCRMKDIDLSIVLGNILDNALEATKEINHADIELHFYIKGNHQNVVCKNTINQSVLKNNPLLHTKKNEKEDHGFGIRSVAETMEKYGGSLEFFEEDHMFCAHVMLPLI